MKNFFSTRLAAAAQGAKAAWFVLGFAILTTTTSMAQSAGALAPRKTSNGPLKAIYISAEYKLDKSYGYVSYAAIYQDELASNDYVIGEDAEIILFDPSMMRFAVFTQAGDNWLAINQFRDERIIPIGFYAQKKTTSEILRFHGDDSYLREWVLVSDEDGAEYPIFDDFAIEVSMPQDGSSAYHLDHRFLSPSADELPLDDSIPAVIDTLLLDSVTIEPVSVDTISSLPVEDDSITVDLTETYDSVPQPVLGDTLSHGHTQNNPDDDTVIVPSDPGDPVENPLGDNSSEDTTIPSDDDSSNDSADLTTTSDDEDMQSAEQTDDSETVDEQTPLDYSASLQMHVSSFKGCLMLDSEMPLGRVWVFSADGALVSYCNSDSSSLSLTLPTGVYVLRVEGLAMALKVQVR